MNFYEVVSQRRSIRSYDKLKPVPAAALLRIAEAVNAAPSACNLQPWKFLVFTNKEKVAQIVECYKGEWLQEAPAIAVLVGNRDVCWKRNDGRSAFDLDMGIVMEHFVLAATAEGLGTCWICAYEAKQLDALLELEAPFETVALSPLGFAAGAPRPFSRKAQSEVFEIID